MECGRRGGDRAAGRSRGLSARDTWRTVPPPPEASLLSLRVLKCVAAARSGPWVIRLQGAGGFTRPSHRKPPPCRVDRSSTNPGAVVPQGDTRTATPGGEGRWALRSRRRGGRRACDPRRRRLRERTLCGGACGASGGGRMGRMAAGGREGREGWEGQGGGGTGGTGGTGRGAVPLPPPHPCTDGISALRSRRGTRMGHLGPDHPPAPAPAPCTRIHPVPRRPRRPVAHCSCWCPGALPLTSWVASAGRAAARGPRVTSRPDPLTWAWSGAGPPSRPPAPQPHLHTCRQGSWGRRPRHHGPRVPTAPCAPAGSAPSAEACPSPPRGCAHPEHWLPRGPGPSPALAPRLHGPHPPGLRLHPTCRRPPPAWAPRGGSCPHTHSVASPAPRPWHCSAQDAARPRPGSQGPLEPAGGCRAACTVSPPQGPASTLQPRRAPPSSWKHGCWPGPGSLSR